MNPIVRIYVLYGVCVGAANAFLIPNIILLGGSQADIARMRLLATCAGLLLSVPTGWLADRFGHKLVTVCGFVLLAAAFAPPASASKIAALIATGTLIAAADATVLGALQLWTQDLDPRVAKLDTVEKLKIFDQRQRYGMIAGAVGISLILSLANGQWLALGWVILLGFALVLLVTGFATGSNVRARAMDSFSERLSKRYDLGAILSYARRSGALVGLASLALFAVGFAEEVSTNIFGYIRNSPQQFEGKQAIS
jgi:MFS family permease